MEKSPRGLWLAARLLVAAGARPSPSRQRDTKDAAAEIRVRERVRGAAASGKRAPTGLHQYRTGMRLSG